tara:strand:+ start:1344 stop:3086 length:1743 start_codon:yes stop_codon:yes gene_type:complete
MKNSIKFYFILTLIFLSCNESEFEKPNILIFLTDDQGWGDLSIHGNNNIYTPNIDNIANNGVRFKRFYVSPVCSPTRAELLTGKYFVRSGVNGVTKGYERMNINHKLISDFFKEKSYKTGLFGKWHNGSQPPYHPNNRGFDEFYGFTSGHWGNYFDPIIEKNGALINGDGYITDDITNKSISFIESSESPFFAFISYNTPHSPMQIPDSFFEKKEVKLQGRYAKNENIIKTRAALAMVENIDYNVGRIIKSLKNQKKYENTIILFLSDNGPNGNRWNLDMKERKGSTNEGGVRVPFFVQWPKKLRKGLVVEQISSVMDIFPSLIDLTDFNHEFDFDGNSFVKYLKDPKLRDDNRKIFSYWNRKLSVRNNNFILDHKDSLYDLNNDLSQTKAVNHKFHLSYVELKKSKEDLISSVLSRYDNSINRNFTVNYDKSKYTHLPARDADFTGDLSRSSIHANDSFIENWINEKDYIFWNINSLSAGKNNVSLYYTLPESCVGTQLTLEFMNNKITKNIINSHDPELEGMGDDRIKRIESYTKEFKKITLGDLYFEEGVSSLKLKTSDLIGNKSIDFRLLVLEKVD